MAGLVITDIVVNGSNSPLAGVFVSTRPLPGSILINEGGGFYEEAISPWPWAISNSSGIWSLTLPWPSACDPQSVVWQIVLSSGVYQGTVPEGNAGPLRLYDLKTTYAWQKVL